MPDITILSSLEEKVKHSLSYGNHRHNQSQAIRKMSLFHYKNAGEALCQIRDILRSEPKATKNNPKETDLGTFKSFSDFLTKQGLNHGQAYDCIFLYENWHLIKRMGLLATEATYRRIRTKKVIKWAHEMIEKRGEEWLDRQEYKYVWYDEKGREQVDIVSDQVHTGELVADESEGIYPVSKYDAYWILEEKQKQSKHNEGDEPSYRELKREKDKLEQDNQHLNNLLQGYDDQVENLQEKNRKLELEKDQRDERIAKLKGELRERDRELKQLKRSNELEEIFR